MKLTHDEALKWIDKDIQITIKHWWKIGWDKPDEIYYKTFVEALIQLNEYEKALNVANTADLPFAKEFLFVMIMQHLNKRNKDDIAEQFIALLEKTEKENFGASLPYFNAVPELIKNYFKDKKAKRYLKKTHALTHEKALKLVDRAARIEQENKERNYHQEIYQAYLKLNEVEKAVAFSKTSKQTLLHYLDILHYWTGKRKIKRALHFIESLNDEIKPQCWIYLMSWYYDRVHTQPIKYFLRNPSERFSRKTILNLLEKTKNLIHKKHTNTRLYSDIATAYLEMDEFEKAIKIYHLLEKQHEKNYILPKIVKSLAEKGLVKRALKYLEAFKKADQPLFLALFVQNYFTFLKNNDVRSTFDKIKRFFQKYILFFLPSKHLSHKKALDLLSRAEQIAEKLQDNENYKRKGYLLESYIVLDEFDKAIKIHKYLTPQFVKDDFGVLIIKQLARKRRVKQFLDFLESLEKQEQAGMRTLFVKSYFGYDDRKMSLANMLTSALPYFYKRGEIQGGCITSIEDIWGKYCKGIH